MGARESYELRAYAERQDPVSSETDFAVFHAFDSGWDFRPNVAADRVEELGGEIRLSPWWGGDPLATQLGLELYGQAARWRSTSDPAVTDYARTSAVLRLAAPIVYPSWRLGMEVGAGTTWGSAPLQRDWFLGGTTTLRGYRASAASGSSFARGRLEIARTYDVGTLSLFGDVGWAGRRGEVDANDLLYAVGVGGSLLDGLVRLDLSQGLTRPFNQFRVDLYLDGLL